MKNNWPFSLIRPAATFSRWEKKSNRPELGQGQSKYRPGFIRLGQGQISAH
jgi:hypothetical protein